MKNTFIRIIIETLYMNNTLNTSILMMFRCFLFCIYYSTFATVHCTACNLITIYLMTFLHLSLDFYYLALDLFLLIYNELKSIKCIYF